MSSRVIALQSAFLIDFPKLLCSTVKFLVCLCILDEQQGNPHYLQKGVNIEIGLDNIGTLSMCYSSAHGGSVNRGTLPIYTSRLWRRF